MGYGSTVNGKQQAITPRNGKNWCDVVNQPTKPCPKCPHNNRGFHCTRCWPNKVIFKPKGM